ncbi:MAG: glycosyltransferase 87 family protein [Actinobacteria bacterium]|nr:glycosyltransferase 87 family protein [Actinomycetota bacterium]MCL6104109.1 glycosyltransferase 87 family protein [Actinomycetota bacterium]
MPAYDLSHKTNSKLHRLGLHWTGLSPLLQDAILYFLSALFALGTIVVSSFPLYRQWGMIAVIPYTIGAMVCLIVAKTVSDSRHIKIIRVVLFFTMLLGVTLIPLALEVLWTAQGASALHAQPEVFVVGRAGKLLLHGHDPYQIIRSHASLHISPNGYKAYFPYLPGMAVLGALKGIKSLPLIFRDPRIVFTLLTLCVSALAVYYWRSCSKELRFRALQLLCILPTAALPLVTGGDDLPVLALLFLGLVLQRRSKPIAAGLVLGIACSLKLTAWPLVVLLAVAVYYKYGRKEFTRMAASISVVLLPAITVVFVRNPVAFIDNVIRYPMGFTGIPSPAASPLIGHLLVMTMPQAKHLVILGLLLVGVVCVAVLLILHPPRSLSSATLIAGLSMLIAIVLAPNTRFGYLIYPINILLWAWMMLSSTVPRKCLLVTPGRRERS